jgi:pyrimidine deaminase RibD-like protein
MMPEKFMLRALEISRRALPECVPNPPVGCVLVKDNEIVSEGYAQQIGDNHAEVQAPNAYSAHLSGERQRLRARWCSRESSMW